MRIQSLWEAHARLRRGQPSTVLGAATNHAIRATIQTLTVRASDEETEDLGRREDEVLCPTSPAHNTTNPPSAPYPLFASAKPILLSTPLPIQEEEETTLGGTGL